MVVVILIITCVVVSVVTVVIVKPADVFRGCQPESTTCGMSIYYNSYGYGDYQRNCSTLTMDIDSASVNSYAISIISYLANF